MKLTKIAQLALRGCKKEVKDRLAEVLDVHYGTICRWIEDGDDNLTKAAAMAIIRKETGLEDVEILEAEPAKA